MTIWVDADACPNVIKEILYRAAERMQMPLVLVANQSLRVPPSRFIRTLRVAAGFDVADNEIVRQCEAELGFSLLHSTTGGRHGGGATLTTEAKALMSAYEQYCSRLRLAADELFRESFGDFL